VIALLLLFKRLSSRALYEGTLFKAEFTSAQPDFDALPELDKMSFPAIPFGTILARDPETIVSQSRGESIGLYSNAQAGVASALASTFALALIFVRLRSSGRANLF
jgi:hypothetical protein